MNHSSDTSGMGSDLAQRLALRVAEREAVDRGVSRSRTSDCGDNSCRYRDRTKPGGMRTNGRCRCDDCPVCGACIRPGRPDGHRSWCTTPQWKPDHGDTTPNEIVPMASADAEAAFLARFAECVGFTTPLTGRPR